MFVWVYVYKSVLNKYMGVEIFRFKTAANVYVYEL